MAESTDSIEQKLANNNISANERMSLTYYLIQLKRRNNPNDADLYWLTKQLINYYIEGISERKFEGYDQINMGKILNFVTSFNLSQRILLLKWTTRKLKANQYEEEAYQLDLEINKLELFNLWQTKGIKRPFKLLFHLTTFNIYSIICSLVFIPLLAMVIFYPLEFQIFHLFNISYRDISDSTFVNHISNCFLMFAGMDGIEVTPTGFLGTSILLLGKVLFFIIVFNFLLDKISNYIEK